MAIRILVGVLRIKRHSDKGRLKDLCFAGCLALVTSCCGKSNAPPPVHPILPTTPVDSIEITPSMVVVTMPPTPGPTKFQLDARLWDQYDRIIPTVVGKNVSWHALEDGFATNVVTLSSYDHSVVVEVPAFPPNDKNITIRAEVEGVWSNPDALINLVVQLPGTQDIVLSSHTPRAKVNVALVDGEKANTQCLADGDYAFVHAAILPDLVGGCDPELNGEVAVFSPDRQLFYEPQQSFAGGQQTVNSGSLSPKLDTLPVKIWSAVQDENLTEEQLQDLQNEHAGRAKDDLELTNAILEANRVGIVLEMVDGWPENTGRYAVGSTRSCPSNESKVSPGVLNIYVVSSMGGDGLYCKSTPGQPEDVIFLHQARVSPSDMAHEIGHALSLWTPGKWGHTDYVRGFRANNAMWSYVVDIIAEGRHHFSLGQAFRMNVDEESWLNHSAGMDAAGNVIANRLARAATLTRLSCQCATYSASPCPKLAKDLLSTDIDLPPGEPWRCVDNLLLRRVPKDKDVVGLLRGRQWSGTGGCEWVGGMPTWHEDYLEGVLRLEFPNLAASGCANWSYAVFFRDHRMWYRRVSDYGKFSYTLMDSLRLEDEPEQPWQVPVVLWFEDDEDGDKGYDATDDKAVAEMIYGGVLAYGTTNRSGITLDWISKREPDDWDTTPNSLKTKLAILLDPLNPLTGTCDLTGTSLKRDSINVYFLVKPKDFEAGEDFDFMESDLGAACMDSTSGTYVIALAVPPNLTRSTTGLAHYLGHVFTLPEMPETDHTIMRHKPLVDGQERALGLTLGQVFHLNVNKDSWLNRSSASGRKGQPTEDCVAAGTQRCPPIVMHVTSP